MHIKIVRHSERLDFSYPLYWLMCIGQYWADTPLTQNGHELAFDKGKQMATESIKFNPKQIYTSPYNRTMSTATEIKSSFPQCEIIIEPLLAEYQPMRKHCINLYPNGIPTTYEGEKIDFEYPETYDNFRHRVNFIIGKLIEKHDDDIIVVTHSEVLKVYINYIQMMYPDLMLDSGSTPYLTTLSFEYDKSKNAIVESSVRLN